MYGSISSQSSSTKTTSLAAVCGFAAVMAIAGVVGSQSTGLYAATAVRPAVQTVASTVAPVRGVRSMVAAAPVQAAYDASEGQVNVASQGVSALWPVAMGMTAVASFLAIVLRKKQPAASMYYAEPIAMAATSGERLVWIPGATPPAHLTGQYPGDRGFDPLGFSKDPKMYERMRNAEVFHGRLAMLGVVGCIFPELLLSKPTWFLAADGLNVEKLSAIALQVIAPIEYWRGNVGFGWDGKDAGLDPVYPGFDPLGITTEWTKVAEIKNGRLAMTAMLGFEAQRFVTGQSPLANLSAHLADPIHNNIATSVAMFSTAGKKSDRPLWFPGGYAPAYLTGEYPADRGFDPFGLAADPATYSRMRVSEVFHGRLAMMAVVGALFPEFIGKGAWYDGPAAAGMGLSQVGTFVLLSGLPEFFRGQGGFVKDACSKSYPGFDPLNLTTDYTKAAEIKNGRLAMTAIAGFAVQHQVTGNSPVQDFLNHWYHPLTNNIAANLASYPVAMFAATGHKDGLWFPGAKAPAHLTGEFPGDRGFDPLGLAVDPKVYARMRIAEVFHGRLAMFGMVGSILPELLGKGAWFNPPADVDGYKLGFLFMAFAAPTEYWRGQGGFGWNKGTMDQSYPGFDPLKLTSDKTKVNEIKNGRLAMMGMLGLEVQRVVTGESPLANLASHLSNPVGNNITTSFAMFTTSGDKVRPLWFPGYKAPEYLTGEFPGDRGFDPFGLAADPKTYERMRISEVFHGRLAMLGVVGCLWPEIIGNGPWYDISDNCDVNKVGAIALQVIAPIEYWRGNGGFGWNGEEEGRDRSYPGFDPLGITDEGTKNGEVKNGRLAMLALAGFAVQHGVTGKSPVENFLDHLNNPVGQNIVANLVDRQVAMFATVGHKDGLWFPNVKPPAHLTGEYPGDRGFDPLMLAADPKVYARMRLSEVFHGRLAMFGIVGSLLPEVLGKGAWFNPPADVDGYHLGFLLMAIAAPTEYFRGQGGFGWEKGTLDRSYPGVDPLGLTSDKTKTNEIKNGRLAMTAMLGLEVQRVVTGESPLTNLATHLANPLGANIATNLAMF